MSDLGRLFRLSQSVPKPLENFTAAALAIAANHDQRPLVEAVKNVDRSGHETDSYPVLDLVLRSESNSVSVVADVQRTLFPSDTARIGYLDLALTVRNARGQESAIWVEVKVDAWESGDQIPVYLEHASGLSPKPDVITLGRTKISELVPFLEWADVVQAVESVSNPHYMWVGLREFLLEEKIVRPTVRSWPADAPACIDVIVDVNRRIRQLWPGASLAWTDGTLRRALQKNVDRELIAVGGPLIYGLALTEGIWQWCLRVSVAKNYERVRLDARRVLEDARQLPGDWARYPDQPELLERRLQTGSLRSHDDIVKWFDDGLQQLHGAGVLNSYLSGLAEKRARKAADQNASTAVPNDGDASS
jgi:hypothetical protein